MCAFSACLTQRGVGRGSARPCGGNDELPSSRPEGPDLESETRLALRGLRHPCHRKWGQLWPSTAASWQSGAKGITQNPTVAPSPVSSPNFSEDSLVTSLRGRRPCHSHLGQQIATGGGADPGAGPSLLSLFIPALRGGAGEPQPRPALEVSTARGREQSHGRQASSLLWCRVGTQPGSFQESPSSSQFLQGPHSGLRAPRHLIPFPSAAFTPSSHTRLFPRLERSRFTAQLAALPVL